MSHAFLSYVREDSELVRILALGLKSYSVEVWVDEDRLQAGSRWKSSIRQAIEEGHFFIACFSAKWMSKKKTYAHEELTQAIEQLRQRPTDQAWFIPVRLDNCKIPDRNIGAGETLKDLQWIDLFSDWFGGLRAIVRVVAPDQDLDSREVKVEWVSEGPVISGNLVRISSSESSALLTRYFEWFPKFKIQEAGPAAAKNRRSTKPVDVMERAHLLASIRACADTYGHVPDDAEMKAGQSELARKMDLFYKFMLMQHFNAQLGH